MKSKNNVPFTTKADVGFTIVCFVIILLLIYAGQCIYEKANSVTYEESLIPVDAEIVDSCFDGYEHNFNGEVSHFVTVVYWNEMYFISYDPEMYRVVNTVTTDTCRVILLERDYSDGTVEYEFVGPNDG